MDLNHKDIIPIGPHLLIAMEQTEEKTPGGIIIPEKVKDQKDIASTKAKIIAMGSEAFLEYNKGAPMPEPGDYVITARYCGIIVDTEQKNHKICTDEDVIAVIKRSD